MHRIERTDKKTNASILNFSSQNAVFLEQQQQQQPSASVKVLLKDANRLYTIRFSSGSCDENRFILFLMQCGDIGRIKLVMNLER